MKSRDRFLISIAKHPVIVGIFRLECEFERKRAIVENRKLESPPTPLIRHVFSQLRISVGNQSQGYFIFFRCLRGGLIHGLYQLVVEEGRPLRQFGTAPTRVCRNGATASV